MDEGQARGEIATPRDGATFRDLIPSSNKVVPASLAALGIQPKRLHEARKLETVDDGALAELLEKANEEHREISGAAIKVRALKRMAELVDEGQERGEIATRDDGANYRELVRSNDKLLPATLPDLGVTRQREPPSNLHNRK